MGTRVKDERYDIVVVGASVAGMAFVLALRDAGLRIALIDTVVEFDERSMTWGHDIEPNGLLALDFLGLLKELIPLGMVHNCWIAERAGGGSLSRWDYSVLAHSHPYALQIRAHVLRRFLRERVATVPGVDMLIPAEFRQLETTGTETLVKVEMSDEERVLRTPLVVGADGPRSRVRAAAGITTRMRRYPHGWADSIFACDESQINEGHIAFGRGEYLGICPTRPGELVAFHLSTAQSRDAYRARYLTVERLRDEYVKLAPILRSSIASLASWDMLTYAPATRVRADQWVMNGLALVGDAAVQVHPVTSQGVCLALEGGLSLATVVRRCFRRGDFSAGGLAPYEAWRRPQAEAIQELGDLCDWGFGSSNRIISHLKNRMLARLDSDQALKKYVMASFCGLHWLTPERLGLRDGLAAAGLLPRGRKKLGMIALEGNKSLEAVSDA